MAKGIRAYDKKHRREIRRRNHVARDLQDNKYRQRVVKSYVKCDFDEDVWQQVLEDDFEDD